MIGRKALSALLVAGGMMSVLVFGAGAANADDKAAVKELPVKDGKIEIVSKMRYAAMLEGHQPNSHDTMVSFNVEKITENAPDLAPDRIGVMDGETVKDEATQVVERSSSVKLSLADKFSNVGSGCYEYKISEGFTSRRDGKPMKDGYCGYQASKVVYHLRVYVTTDAATGKHVLHAVTAESQDGVKVDKLEFSSMCGRSGSFSVDSKAKGDFADGSKLFEYVIKIEKSPVVMDVDNKDGSSFGVRISVDGKGVSPVFGGKGFVVSSKLKGGSISIIAPVGTRYCVYVKEHKDGYTPSYKKLETTKREVWRVGEDKEYSFTITNSNDDISELATIAYRTDLYEVVHTYNDNDIPVTGLSLDDRTGLVMAVVALGSIAALGVVTVVIRNKFTDR